MDIQRLQSNLLGISQSVVEQAVEDLKKKYERTKKSLLTSQERKNNQTRTNYKRITKPKPNTNKNY